MKIERIFNEKFELINSFLLSNFSSPTHWPDWNLVMSKHYNTEFFYFVAYEDNTLVGICPAHRIKDGSIYKIFSGQYLGIPNGGWIFSKKYIPEKIIFPLKYNESFRSNYLPLLPEFNKGVESLEIDRAKTLVIDLNKEVEEIWTDEFTSKRRGMIRKAEKRGVQISRLQENEFDEFYSIYCSSHTRYGIELMPNTVYKDLFNSSTNISFEVLLAKYEDVIQSIVVVAYDKNYAIYWRGFSNEGTLNNGQGDLLQWEAIKFAKEQGCKYYDLCYIDKEKLLHIYRFKKGFSQNEIEIPIIDQKPITYKIINKLVK